MKRLLALAGLVSLIADFQFGDISNAGPLASGSTVAIKVFVGAGVDCASTATPILNQRVAVPAVAAVALVATSGPGPFTPALIPGAGAAVSQVAPPVGRIQAVHAAAAPALLIDIAATTNGPLAYGETLDKEEPPRRRPLPGRRVPRPGHAGPADPRPCPGDVVRVDRRLHRRQPGVARALFIG
jgi:hypothetical protein